jgi:hypothetical protein
VLDKGTPSDQCQPGTGLRLGQNIQ